MKQKRKPPQSEKPEKPKLKGRLKLEPIYDLNRTVDLGQRILKAQALTRADKQRARKERRPSHDDAA